MPPSSELVCPQCAYALRGIAPVRCPECGFQYDHASLISTANLQLDVIYTRLTWSRALALVPLVTGAGLALMSVDPLTGRIRGSIVAFGIWAAAVATWIALLRCYSHEKMPRAFLPAGVLGYLLVLLHLRLPLPTVIIESACLLVALALLFWTSPKDNRLANASAGSNREWLQVWRWTCGTVALGVIGLVLSMAI